jgi:hypothetical protein
MKNFFFFSFLLISTACFAQTIRIDSISIIKADAKEVVDTSIFKNLEAFSGPDDAIVYIYRLSAMAGAAGKWQVQVDDQHAVNMKQKEYFVVHLSTLNKGHYFQFPSMVYIYTHFKPHHYYFVMLKGFDMKTGYLDAKRLAELNTCKLSVSVQ